MGGKCIGGRNKWISYDSHSPIARSWLHRDLSSFAAQRGLHGGAKLQEACGSAGPKLYAHSPNGHEQHSQRPRRGGAKLR